MGRKLISRHVAKQQECFSLILRNIEEHGKSNLPLRLLPVNPTTTNFPLKETNLNKYIKVDWKRKIFYTKKYEKMDLAARTKQPGLGGVGQQGLLGLLALRHATTKFQAYFEVFGFFRFLFPQKNDPTLVKPH